MLTRAVSAGLDETVLGRGDRPDGHMHVVGGDGEVVVQLEKQGFPQGALPFREPGLPVRLSSGVAKSCASVVADPCQGLLEARLHVDGQDFRGAEDIQPVLAEGSFKVMGVLPGNLDNHVVGRGVVYDGHELVTGTLGIVDIHEVNAHDLVELQTGTDLGRFCNLGTLAPVAHFTFESLGGLEYGTACSRLI